MNLYLSLQLVDILLLDFNGGTVKSMWAVYRRQDKIFYTFWLMVFLQIRTIEIQYSKIKALLMKLNMAIVQSRS